MNKIAQIILNTFVNRLMPNMRTPISLLLAGMSPLFIYLVSAINLSSAELRFNSISGYILFAVLSGSLMSSSSSAAMDRAYGWGSYLRTMPAPAWPSAIGNGLAHLCVTIITVLPMIIAFLISTPDVSIITALLLLSGIIPPAIAFSLIGTAIGLACRPENTAYIATATYMLAAILGGLFSGGLKLPIIPEMVYKAMPSLWAYRFFAGVINGHDALQPLFALIFASLLWYLTIQSAHLCLERMQLLVPSLKTIIATRFPLFHSRQNNKHQKQT